MKASVVITTYDDDLRLGLTLWGWSGQSTKDFELVVVNDGGSSEQATADLVLSFKKYLPVRYEYLLPKKDPEKPEFRLAAARNLGLRHASGDLCIISDCDTIPEYNVVDLMTKKARDNRVLIGIRKRINITLVPMLNRHIFHKLDELAYSNDERMEATDLRTPFLALKDTAPPGSWDYCWGCLFAAPLKHFKALGGFDERFTGWGGEDCDMAERLVRGAGCGLYSMPEAVVYHLDHRPRDSKPYVGDKKLAEFRASYTHTRNGGPIE